VVCQAVVYSNHISQGAWRGDADNHQPRYDTDTMTPLEEAIEALKAAHEAKDAAMQRAIAEVDYQFANIIRVRTMEYEDELKRELHRR
jgi:hypothetical protein